MRSFPRLGRCAANLDLNWFNGTDLNLPVKPGGSWSFSSFLSFIEVRLARQVRPTKGPGCQFCKENPRKAPTVSIRLSCFLIASQINRSLTVLIYEADLWQRLLLNSSESVIIKIFCGCSIMAVLAPCLPPLVNRQERHYGLLEPDTRWRFFPVVTRGTFAKNSNRPKKCFFPNKDGREALT